MDDPTKRLWQTKLLAWTHDPAEKALVLLRDPEGHEGGTIRALRDRLFGERQPADLVDLVKKADRWAAAADRPQFPRDKEGGRFQKWAQVRFDRSPVLIHPLSGDRIGIREGFAEIDPEHLKAVSFDHFSDLILKTEDGYPDWRRTALSFWRFGPELASSEMGGLWQVLPADTRVPDHTIWTHLDLTSAFAGAFAVDPGQDPALLVVSFGPVQGFIAQARSISDLWAGSHLLSMMCWQGIRVVCEDLGPDAVIYPQLRGVPVVDVWLTEQGIPKANFTATGWMRLRSDANPLFAAALPNKFMALVPACLVEKIAGEIVRRTRAWVKEQAMEAVRLLVKEAGVGGLDLTVLEGQVDGQLGAFPEIHWAAAPWSLTQVGSDTIETKRLEDALGAFFPATGKDVCPGFLGSSLWKMLSDKNLLKASSFFRPNRGVLYPAFYDLLERVHSASKAARFFDQAPQEGIRCSLCGEREWLTVDRKALALSPGQRVATLWSKVAERRRRWAKKGEHLCALCALKRLWPDLFVASLRPVLDITLGRYVVSTHTMALATSLDRWLERLGGREGESVLKDPDFLRLSSYTEACDAAALPRSLQRKLEKGGFDARVADFARKLPVLLDELREHVAAEKGRDQNKAEQDFRAFEKGIRRLLGTTGRPEQPLEAYYGLILMDGDRMGSWLTAGASGGEDRNSFALAYKARWHPEILAKGEHLWKAECAALSTYLDAPSAPSPGRHMAVSSALNAFSLHVAPYIVERLFKGKLIYSGGDDLLAMVSVDDLLPAMLLLRLSYSGLPFGPIDDLRSLFQSEGVDQGGYIPRANNGYIGLRDRLLRVMGTKATASMGAVVAHHTAPLTAVMRCLREAEVRAKQTGGRDAFSMTVLKRAGGALHLTAPWFVEVDPGDATRPRPGTVGLLLRLRNALNDPDMSRRAAYLVSDWIRLLPTAESMGDAGLHAEMLAKNLAFQLRRQCRGQRRYEGLGEELVTLAQRARGRTGDQGEAPFLGTFMAVAEFFMREGRIEFTGRQQEVAHA